MILYITLVRGVLISSGLKADSCEDYESQSTEMELLHGVFLLTLIMWKVRVAQMIGLIGAILRHGNLYSANVEMPESVPKFGLWC